MFKLPLPLSNRPFPTWVDADIHHLVKHRTWRVKESDRGEYVCTSVRIGGKNRTVRLHRFIMNCPRGKQVHHLDGDVFNNVRSNLDCLEPGVHSSMTNRIRATVNDN